MKRLIKRDRNPIGGNRTDVNERNMKQPLFESEIGDDLGNAGAFRPVPRFAGP